VVVAGIAAGVVALREVLGSDGRPGAGRAAEVLKAHDAELRSIQGVTMLGTYSDGTSGYIVVYVKEVTPQIEAAVPDKLDGVLVQIQKEASPPPDPPELSGAVKAVEPATKGQAAASVAGEVTIDGELLAQGPESSSPVPRRLTVVVPASVRIWRPQGEGKEFIEFADIRIGDECRATLVAVPKSAEDRARATDLEVYAHN
jgi:hypothetical protein